MRLLNPVDEAPAAAAPGPAAIAARTSPHAGPGRLVVACSTLAGEPVVNRADEELGTLEHVIIDVSDGRIAYGVLSRGGVLGLGARLHAVPWNAFTLDVERMCFVLDVSLARLRQAPAFDREDWPRMDDARLARAAGELFPQRVPDDRRSLR